MSVKESSLDNKKQHEERQVWNSKLQSICVAIGAVIGLGNVWRFPYIVYAYGGGAFLIPYCVFAVFCGFPMIFLEVSLGQLTRSGAFKAWNYVPLLKGIGLGCIVIAAFSSLYYITVMAWAINYFASTLTTGRLPWTHCDNWFNTNSCITYDDAANLTIHGNLFSTEGMKLPIVEYWDLYNLRKTGGLDDMGSLNNIPLIISFLTAWLMVYLSVFKGVTSTGKVAYFSAVFPYVILFILLVRGCTLPGAAKGIQFYLKPNMTKLMEPNVWIAAGTQVCYSYAICFAVLITIASYNQYKRDTFRYAVMIASSCSLTSFLSGFAIFSVLGNMALVMNREVSQVVESGPGLAFLAYPTALSFMPFPQFWNALFFLMLITLGVDCEFTTMEGVLTAFYDSFPSLLRHKEWFSFVIILLMVLIGLVFTMNGGVYVFEIFNSYAVGGIPLLWLVTLQSIAIGWVYGSDRFMNDVERMIGYRPTRFLDLCIKYFTPALSLGVFMFYCATTSSSLKVGNYTYPPWAMVIAWILCFASFVCVPCYALYEISQQNGPLLQRVKIACKSNVYKEPISLDETFQMETKTMLQ